MQGTSTPVGGITVIETPDSTIARLWGEIDESLRAQAGGALGRALQRGLRVVLDAGQVRFIDSAGIAFLIQFCRIGREEGLDVTLLEPPTVVAEVLEMLGLTHMFGPAGEVPSAGAAQNGSSSSAPLGDRGLRGDLEVGGDPPLVPS